MGKIQVTIVVLNHTKVNSFISRSSLLITYHVAHIVAWVNGTSANMFLPQKRGSIQQFWFKLISKVLSLFMMPNNPVLDFKSDIPVSAEDCDMGKLRV